MSDISALLDAQDTARAAITPSARPQQLVRTVQFGDVKPIARDLAVKVCETYDMTPNNAAVINAGSNGAGEPTVLYALKREKTPTLAAASVTIYAKGSVVFAGVPAIGLDGEPIPE